MFRKKNEETLWDQSEADLAIERANKASKKQQLKENLMLAGIFVGAMATIAVATGLAQKAIVNAIPEDTEE